MRISSTKATVFLLVGGLVAYAGLVVAPATLAMPNFARQYNADCALCHSVIPRLNKTGYEFRRAGFRMPAEIGQAREWEKNRETAGFIGANYFSARLQANASYLKRDHATATGGYSASSGSSYSTNQIELTEFTLYPVTGGFLGHWASMAEISGTTDNIEVENAYVRYTAGKESGFWEVRIGVFHPFEGYGASDRVIGLSRPLIQTQGSVNAHGDKNGFTPWGFDEAGAEAGFNLHDTSLSLTVFNGLMENAADPAQGGGLRKERGSPTESSKDYQVFFNQFFGDQGLAVSAYYYNGRISLGSALYKNTFDRYAAYVTVPVQKVMLLGGYGGGDDKEDITGNTSNSKGWFFETDYYASPTLGLGARYDQYDPSDLIKNNNVKAFTAFVDVPFNNGLQLVGEYRNKKTQHGSGPDQTESSANLRFIYIW